MNVALALGIIFTIVFGAIAYVFAAYSRDKTAGIFAILAVAFLVAGVAFYPNSSVWQAKMKGLAELSQAESSRQIRVLEAKAAKESAVMLADAEIERAKGVAEANKIIADGLGGAEGYLRYLYIQSIQMASEKGSTQFIYLPTEAGLPVLEASRLGK